MCLICIRDVLIIFYLFIRNDIIILNNYSKYSKYSKYIVNIVNIYYYNTFILFIKSQYSITKNVYNNILIFFIFALKYFY